MQAARFACGNYLSAAAALSSGNVLLRINVWRKNRMQSVWICIALESRECYVWYEFVSKEDVKEEDDDDVVKDVKEEIPAHIASALIGFDLSNINNKTSWQYRRSDHYSEDPCSAYPSTISLPHEERFHRLSIMKYFYQDTNNNDISIVVWSDFLVRYSKYMDSKCTTVMPVIRQPPPGPYFANAAAAATAERIVAPPPGFNIPPPQQQKQRTNMVIQERIPDPTWYEMSVTYPRLYFTTRSPYGIISTRRD